MEDLEKNELSSDLFEEISVTELEDRLELAFRCSCRNGGNELTEPAA